MLAFLHDCYFLPDAIFCATHWTYALSPECRLALLMPFSQQSDFIPWIITFHSLDGLSAARQDGSEPGGVYLPPFCLVLLDSDTKRPRHVFLCRFERPSDID